ncbi:InlB B-repeat-containing protein [Erysipelothrix anatis]|uniref:InlB B-repeat-containing protein n=1 Tax=Erysipelothrix anatis TaxID=2683713 RepID=UPI00135AF057|nr:InlB B-repeat-containing protein [Erysipelothrix anatis]
MKKYTASLLAVFLVMNSFTVPMHAEEIGNVNLKNREMEDVVDASTLENYESEALIADGNTNEPALMEQQEGVVLADDPEPIVSTYTQLVDALAIAQNGDTITIQEGAVITLDQSLKINTGSLSDISFKSSGDAAVTLLSTSNHRHVEVMGTNHSSIHFNNIVLSGDNSATKGGITYNVKNNNHVLSGLVVRNNVLKTDWYDGFIKVAGNGGSFRLENALFDSNTFKAWTDGKGSGIVILDTVKTDVTVSDVVFSKNVTANQDGEPLQVFNNNGNYTFERVSFLDNLSHGRSAGIAYSGSSNSNLTIDDSRFENNIHHGYKGGAISFDLEGAANVQILNSNFESNTSNRGGGAIYADIDSDGGALTIDNSSFTNNKASRIVYNPETGESVGELSDGGAISITQLRNSSHVAITNSQFANNEATTGGAFYLDNEHGATTQVRIDNVEFDGNTADYTGGTLNFNNNNDMTSDDLYIIKNSRIANSTVLGHHEDSGYNEGGDGGAIYYADIENYPSLLRLENVQFENNVSQAPTYWQYKEGTSGLSAYYTSNFKDVTPSTGRNSFMSAYSNALNNDDVYYPYSGFTYFEFLDDNDIADNFESFQYIHSVVGEKTQTPLMPTASGFRFIGWFDGSDSLWNFEGEAQPETHHELYGKFEKIRMYIVTFESNGGSKITSLKDIQAGSLIASPLNPTREGYVFKGWFVNPELTTPWNFVEHRINADTTLYASWEKVMTETFTVHFDSQGGTAVASYIDIEKGAFVEEPVAPIRKGFVFGGWYQDATLNNRWEFSSHAVTENITLYAKWDKVAESIDPVDPTVPVNPVKPIGPETTTPETGQPVTLPQTGVSQRNGGMMLLVGGLSVLILHASLIRRKQQNRKL